MPLTLQSPAKINLFLRIIKRRDDGYHELASLFQAISLFDSISFELHSEDKLTCSDPTLPLDSKNLVMKAAALFRKKTGLKFSLLAHLEKRIPYQAGLGGGSSNAATTLWALNELCGKPASLENLIAWSAEIGSDIPFFLTEGTAYCTGRGENLRHLSRLRNTPLWIVKPKMGLSTPEVYGTLDVSILEKRDPEKSLCNFLAGHADYFNDLESSAFKIMPLLAKVKQHLVALGFDAVLMSGSGSAFFCMGDANPNELENDFFYHKAQFVNRQPGQWY